MKRGLFIGRFQPLHRGHLMMMKKCANAVDTLIVGLGSSNALPSCRNPFTADERRGMISRGMREAGVKNYEVIELPDVEDDAEWVKMAKKTAGPFDSAWSGSDWVLRVFARASLPIERIKEFPGLSSTKIRRRIRTHQPWLKFVPLSVRKYLREIKAVRRIRDLCMK